MKVGIVGCGLIGKKRAASIDADDSVLAAFDTSRDALESFSSSTGCEAAESWSALVEDPRIDAVIVSAFHKVLAEIGLAALRAGKHVLIEKPAARNANELRPVVEFHRAAPKHIVAKCGFNHRFHPAFLKAREVLAGGDYGDLMFVRARYGHGGRVGYEKEWRADPDISGGGELLDQGMHLIDLSRLFLGDFVRVEGIARTFFWDMPVDDNAFLLLETAADQVAQLHVSWTEWKNTFSFEIYTKKLKMHVEGLGGSYGVERLSCYYMHPGMGPPETVIYEFPGPDSSWKAEWKNFKGAVSGREPLSGSIEDALKALEIVERVYGKTR